MEAVKRLFLALWEVVKQVVIAWQPLINLVLGLTGEGSLTGLDLVVGLFTMLLDIVTLIVRVFAKLIELAGKLTAGIIKGLDPLTKVLTKVSQAAGLNFKNVFGSLSGVLNSREVESKLGLYSSNGEVSIKDQALALVRGKESGQSGTVSLDFKNVPQGLAIKTDGNIGNITTDNGAILAPGF